jgi:ATP-dependent DNA ligase
VVEGSGIATINGHKNKLKAGTIVLIEAGDRHEIRNTGRTLLKTVNVYVPPAIATKRQSFRPVAAPPEHSPMARPSKVPKQLQPMLATLIDAPFDSKDWVFENKWDGFRLVAKIENQSVTLY